jgi:hypothetical protein
MIRLTVDAFGISVLPPAVITRELSSQQVQFLKVTRAFPSLMLHASHRVTQAHPVIGSLVSLARQVARDFSREHGPDVLELPDGSDSPLEAVQGT